ncbi:hypothetical protein BDB01DRAFT_72760 [Pilobolus umbonatus]|nr:hypothetical protein BDB01DRAFT_72760 [Pilobolus umbonatus]
MSSVDFDNYLQWIKTEGGTYHGIELKNGCAYTTETITEDDTFVTVPFKVCITESKARKEFPSLAEIPSKAVQAYYLAFQRTLGKQSYYWPYINILPKTIMTPLYFNEDDFYYIQNTNLASATRERMKALQEDFAKILNALPATLNKNMVSWDYFLWAYTIYTSRAFPYRLIDPTSTESSEALFPLVDSLNHKPHTKITWCRKGDINDGSLSFVSGEVYPPGKEIYNNYGPKVGIGIQHKCSIFTTLTPYYRWCLSLMKSYYWVMDFVSR